VFYYQLLYMFLLKYQVITLTIPEAIRFVFKINLSGIFHEQLEIVIPLSSLDIILLE
jgi:hypothetical protein